MKCVGVLSALSAALSVSVSATNFASKKAHQLEVKHLPKVTFDLPTSWAGTLPVSNKTDESKELFFWLFPPANDVGHDDVVIWLNGGPGCSSLDGIFEENGPFSFKSDKVDTKLVPNKYSWTNLSHVVWVESPIGVGFTKGKPDIQGMYGQAREFYGFLEQFYETFAELKGKRLWITGESYAGKYIPYIAHEIYKHESHKNQTGINLQGIAINDPSFTSDFLGEEAPAFEFLEKYQHVMGVNDTSVEHVRKLARKYGVETYVADNLHYPPKGHFYAPKSYKGDVTPVWNTVNYYANASSNCFNVYYIKPNCSSTKDPLGMPFDAVAAHKYNFLNANPSFKEALHVPRNKTWLECTHNLNDVFKNVTRGDVSLPPDTTVLPGVIEKSVRTVIQHGTWDFVLIANGTQLGIQNMTWAGKQGFHSKPNLTLTAGEKPHGVFHEERGLTLALVSESGHMIPQFKPKTAFALQQYLLGQVSKANITSS